MIEDMYRAVIMGFASLSSTLRPAKMASAPAGGLALCCAAAAAPGAEL